MTQTITQPVGAAAAKAQVLVWDLPTRLFHWLLAGAFAVAWYTNADNRYLGAHVYAGYLFLGLILFRLLWGIWGTYHARFRSFAYDWSSVAAYLRALWTGKAERYLGHNPAGSWAIFLMLGLGLTMSVVGVLMLGGIEAEGPAAALVPFAHGEKLALVHEVLGWAMLTLVGTHLAGVAVESLFHRENLVHAMITGHKEVETGAAAAPVSPHKGVGLFMLGLSICSAVIYFGQLIPLGEGLHPPFQHVGLPQNEAWESECKDCHLAYHPTLLPARSWDRLFATQADHFGEDLSLDEKTIAELKSYAIANGSETRLSAAAVKIDRSIPPGAAPLRISETPYWVHKHRSIEPSYWKHEKVKSKANCGACHEDADRGTFGHTAMHLPKLPRKSG